MKTRHELTIGAVMFLLAVLPISGLVVALSSRAKYKSMEPWDENYDFHLDVYVVCMGIQIMWYVAFVFWVVGW